MDFLPATRMLLNEMIRFGEVDVAAALLRLAEDLERVVPDLVGLSLGQVKTGLVFTLAASSVEAAAIDASQYVDGGPCVEASTHGHREAWVHPASSEDPLDERRWTLYARATAAAGVASSLSLPLVVKGRTVGGVNLYASTPDAFDGRHDEVARLLGAGVTHAVADADLGFTTRAEAEQGPARLWDLDQVHIAVGVIIERQHVDAETARTRLADSARRAGVTEVQAARALLQSFHR